LCSFLRIAERHFWEIAETFRNPAVWNRLGGKWSIEGFIVEDWVWE
jgi:hypothetical protein